MHPTIYKLACANCHLNQKAIEIEAPQAVLPNSVFEVEVKVPYDTSRQQIGANGQKADLNVGGIVILPKGFKLAPKNQIPAEVKQKNKGVFISPYSTEFDNILVVGPIAGKTHQELIFPVVAPDPAKVIVSEEDHVLPESACSAPLKKRFAEPVTDRSAA